ncbi:chitinase [Candidatus Francisella endociliophora]|uniref:Chitinase n=1 Tax=Candidatus Francisella endociliophora TaxID=653937 RepID=A0A097EPI2_9GAMM|nr:glycosyl hydrolase family 18 protein [Francisella sp. FSC1006]AIT09475.1 chitinase [Francisella sp. FSC1006]
MKQLCKKAFILLILFASIFSLLNAASISDVEQKNNILPDRMIAGFLDIRTPGSTTRVDMQKAKNDGYNVVIVAFGEVYGTDIGFYTSSDADISSQTAVDKIRRAEKAGMKVLLAVGGVPNTFHPGVKRGEEAPKIFGKGMSQADVDTLANNIVTFLHKYKMKGIVYSIKKFVSPSFINDLSAKIKEIDHDLAIVAEPEVNNYRLVTTGRSNDYDTAIQNGNIDYLFIQEYNSFMESDPNFIADSYSKIIENSKIPLTTKVVVDEPTNSVSGGTNTIYHPQANATESLTTEEAVGLMLPQLEKLKFKPRFAGMAGWSLNTDYAADLYGDSKHNSGAFARELSNCIYKNVCASIEKKIEGPVVAGLLPLWGKSSSYNISGQQINTDPVDISMPKDKEYCDKNPQVCKYNIIIVGYINYTGSKGFYLTFNEENGSSEKIYTPEQLKQFINYMKSKGKHVLVDVGGKFSHINWTTIDLSGLVKIVEDYGFDGVNFHLTDSDIPKNEEVSKIAAQKISRMLATLKQKNPSFWLAFSPDWHYIVAPLAKNSRDNIYTNRSYLDLLSDIGINNINYIFLNTYSEKAADSILSFYKNDQGEYQKISPVDGYGKFLASLAWALTTQDGYDANKPKYKVANPLEIPASKLVFMIPPTEGAVHSGMVYVLSEQDIDETVKLMKNNKASFAGFAISSLDFDATEIKDGDLGQGYSHKPWATTDTISDITLPPVVSQIVNKSIQKKEAEQEEKKQESIEGGIVNYPANIGSYDGNTIVNYQGKRYKCISSLEAKLCNDRGYIPNGLHGYLAWEEINQDTSKKETKQRIIMDGETPKYPDGIGSYKKEQVVVAGDRKFECRVDKLELCNNISFDPISKKGYMAWTDITDDVTHLSRDQKQVKPKGAEYIYPNGIEDYTGGTIVAVGKELYRCKVGPESSLCNKEAYDPTGKYGADAWTKLDE